MPENQTAPESRTADPDLRLWRQRAEEALSGSRPGTSLEDVLCSETLEGVELQGLYTRQDAFQPLSQARRRGGPWEIAQELTATSPERLRVALEKGLAGGLTAAVLVLDEASRAGLPTLGGQSEGLPGGTILRSVDAMSRAVGVLAPGQVPIHLVAGVSAIPAAALLAGVLGRRVGEWRGSAGFDPSAALVSRGHLPMSWESAFDELAMLSHWAIRDAPRLATLVVDVVPYHDAGATAVQELTFALASAVTTLRALEARGVGVSEALPRLRFSFGVGSRLFMEIAKLRAARMLWARISEACGEPDTVMTLHVRGARRNKALMDRHTNILRASGEALAAVIGGCDSLHVTPYDEISGTASDAAQRLARNTQLLLREEVHLDQVADPLGGSWYVESLTRELAERAWTGFQKLETDGGWIAALERGEVQAAVHEVAAERTRRLGAGDDVLVGTSRYTDASESYPTQASLRQLESVARSDRETPREASNPLVGLSARASSDGRTFGALAVAATAGAALEDLAGAVRSGADDGPRVTRLRPWRGPAPFENPERKRP
jgi:methylmalonyl-CoA mutase